ncbi:MAG: penicillin acylase family protein, partial [Ferruginibacter sp.]
GNTSKTLWTKYHPISDLPQYLNPPSGYLFNSNHSPFNATARTYNLLNKDFDPTMGFETNENNRSVRFMELLSPHERIDYLTFKKIKFDRQLPVDLAYSTNSDTLFLIRSADYPALSVVIDLLQNWDRKGSADSKGATVFAIIYYYVVDKLNAGDTSFKVLTKQKAVEVYTYANDYLQKFFKTTNVALGDYQKLVRGNKSIPLSGIPDVIASMQSAPYKNGMVKGTQGESYIELVKFTKKGPEIESIHSYGASNKKGNKHFDDQMEMFEKQQLKPMTFDKATIYKNAERIYHPQ